MKTWIDIYRESFTKWYYSKGYKATYDFGTSFGDFRVIFKCPFWLRPITPLLFSPSVYFYESGKELATWFLDGMKSVDTTVSEYLGIGGTNEKS